MLGISDDKRLPVLACRTRAHGGAVYAAWLDKITLDNSRFERNMVALLTNKVNGTAYGSAVYATRADLKLESCQIIGNTAFDTGGRRAASGAVYTADVSNFRLSDCAFSQNIASKGEVSLHTFPGACMPMGGREGMYVQSLLLGRNACEPVLCIRPHRMCTCRLRPRPMWTFGVVRSATSVQR